MPTHDPDAAITGRTGAALSPAPGAPVVSVRGLRKRYGDREAVRGIDLDIHRGEIFAFLGPNGAGKTTTVEILEGFRRATDGVVRVLGTDPWRAPSAWRERIGIVLQESEAEPGLTVHECLSLYRGYYRTPRDVDETLALVDLAEQADQRATALSGGQRRRLDVALALIGDPELIFLDEPTTGFDPSARRAAWKVVSGLRDLGKTVFLTTHYMEEAERLADRIAVITAGRIVAEGTPKTLGGRQLEAAQVLFSPPSGSTVGDLPADLASRVEREDGGRPDPEDESRVEREDGRRPDPEDRGRVARDYAGRLRLASTAVASDLHRLAGWALQRGAELDDLEVLRPTLEDVYLELTKTHELDIEGS